MNAQFLVVGFAHEIFRLDKNIADLPVSQAIVTRHAIGGFAHNPASQSTWLQQLYAVRIVDAFIRIDLISLR